jgi:hypothetical protein
LRQRIGQGDVVIFVVRHRPVMGEKGFYRASRIRSGLRHTMGIIFHDGLVQCHKALLYSSRKIKTGWDYASQ